MTDTKTTIQDQMNELREVSDSLNEYRARIDAETAEARQHIANVQDEYAEVIDALTVAKDTMEDAIKDQMREEGIRSSANADYLFYSTPKHKFELIDITAAKKYLESIGKLETYTTINKTLYVKDFPEGVGVRKETNISIAIRDDRKPTPERTGGQS